jgi:hypothetical protein
VQVLACLTALTNQEELVLYQPRQQGAEPVPAREIVRFSTTVSNTCVFICGSWCLAQATDAGFRCCSITGCSGLTGSVLLLLMNRAAPAQRDTMLCYVGPVCSRLLVALKNCTLCCH